jgi:hypothetical protein
VAAVGKRVRLGRSPSQITAAPRFSPSRTAPTSKPTQAYTSRARVEGFSLIADMMYVAQNAPRISRALFEIALRRKWGSAAWVLLQVCKVGLGPAEGRMPGLECAVRAADGNMPADSAGPLLR